jgi:hypothetical protein
MKMGHDRVAGVADQPEHLSLLDTLAKLPVRR